MVDLRMRPVELACMLGRLGARFAVVGSTARMLTTGIGRPLDLDIVVDEADLPRLVPVLSRLSVRTTVASLTRSRQVRLATSWGPLDIFVAARPVSHQIHIGDVLLGGDDMSGRTGLSQIEVAVLEAVDAQAARPHGPFCHTMKVLDSIDQTIGLGPGTHNRSSPT